MSEAFNLLAVDVAIELGGVLLNTPNPNYIEVKIESENIVIGLHHRPREARIQVSISPDLTGIKDRSYMSLRRELPTANVSETRSPAAIAKDIRRRVIEPGKVLAWNLRNDYEARDKQADDLKTVAAEYEKLGCYTRELRDGATDCYIGNMVSSGTYFNGRLYPDGRVSINRVGMLSRDKFVRILAILKEPEAS